MINCRCGAYDVKGFPVNRWMQPSEDRTGNLPMARGFAGDFDTPEQTICRMQTDRPWETCMPLQNFNGQWSYSSKAEMKSLKEVLQTLVNVVGRDGNLMVSPPLKPDGSMVPRAEELLAGCGKWLAAVRNQHLRHPRRTLLSDAVRRLHLPGRHHFRACAELARRYSYAASDPVQARIEPTAHGRKGGRSPKARRIDRDCRSARTPPRHRHDRGVETGRSGERGEAGTDGFGFAGDRQAGPGVERVRQPSLVCPGERGGRRRLYALDDRLRHEGSVAGSRSGRREDFQLRSDQGGYGPDPQISRCR